MTECQHNDRIYLPVLPPSNNAEADLLSLVRGEQLETFSVTVRRKEGDAWFIVLSHPNKQNEPAIRVGSGSSFDEAWMSLIEFEPE